MPQNWLFLPRYRKQRESLLKQTQWRLLARLGPGAFETIGGEVVQAVLLTLGRAPVSDNGVLQGIDASLHKTAMQKAIQLRDGVLVGLSQKRQLENPDAIVAFELVDTSSLLQAKARAWQGLVTADDKRYVIRHWEVASRGYVWDLMQQAPDSQAYFTGRTDFIRWEQGSGALHSSRTAHNFPPKSVIGRKGIAVQRMRSLNVTLYDGQPFDDSVSPLLPNNPELLSALWCYAHSEEYLEEVRRINQSVKVVPGSLTKVAFDEPRWTAAAAERYPNGLPKAHSDDPTQWVFHGHPCGSVVWSDETKQTVHGLLRCDQTVLQVAVARLLGCRWPAESDEAMELADDARAWVTRCRQLDSYADDDGIVCIPPVRGEPAAEARLRDLLAAAYGKDWSSAIEGQLLADAGYSGQSLEAWLRDGFFSQHCQLFQQRPFIWHVWDGLRDGFAALLNYHRLDHKRLETLTYTYLGDWIARQKQEIASGVEGAQERLAAAEALQQRLELILAGEKPYDIFVRWKPLPAQPIGWNPDLNDGVRLNIRPFLSVPDVRKKGAGVLRERPRIDWKKDGGSDVASAPWYQLGPLFGGKPGDRINDHHLSLAEKVRARAKPTN